MIIQKQFDDKSVMIFPIRLTYRLSIGRYCCHWYTKWLLSSASDLELIVTKGTEPKIQLNDTAIYECRE